MVNIHNTVGTLVVLAYLALTAVNVLRITGRDVPIGRPLSFVAAGLLLLQYILGFTLLGQGSQIPPIHFIIALLAIVTVGLEHGYARSRPAPELRAMAAMLATGATTILVTASHIIGSAN